MIDHNLKCIFIHIPATGGSIIEKSLIGKDWQDVDPTTKHLDATLSKIYYKEYWDEYFKFTFVRNPFDWMVSMYSKTRPPELKGISFEDYIVNYAKFLYMSWEYPLNRIQIPMVRNIKELDFIGRFENLEEHFYEICERLNIKRQFHKEKLHANKRDKQYSKYYDETTKNMIELIFKKDLEEFAYDF